MGMRFVFAAVAAALVAAGVVLANRGGPAAPGVSAQAAVVHLSPTCGCCKGWAEHMEAGGFTLERDETVDMPAVKARLGVPNAVYSCHTAEIGGYVVEGHVPADIVQRLLREKPDGVVGIGVAGMPSGSPGMEVPGQPAQPYQVLAWDETGRTWVYDRR